MSAPTNYFHVANHYLGWGEAKDGLWFIGLEEASSWTIQQLEDFSNSPEEISGHKQHSGFSELGRKGQAVRALTCRIAQPLSRDYAEQTWREYRDHRFWQPGCKLLQLNFYPLGKPRWNEWPEDFKALFGFDESERVAYEREVASTRFERIKSLSQAHRPQAVVCFGVIGWPAARTIFDLDARDEERLSERIVAYPARRVILTPFFTYRFFRNSDAALVAAKLKEWGVSLP